MCGPRSRPGHGSRRVPAGPSSIADQPALHLRDAAEDEARVHRQPDRLLQRGGREVQVEQAVGLAAVAVRGASRGRRRDRNGRAGARPGRRRRSGEVAAEEVDRHLALAFALQGGRARGDVGIDGGLGQGEGGRIRAARRAAANTRRSPGSAAGETRLACRGRESIAVSKWHTRSPLARGRRPSGEGRQPPRSQSGMFPCFLGGIAVPLGPEGPERVDQPGPGVARIDHVVDVAAGRRGVGMGELARCTPRSAARWRRRDRRPRRSRP